ncbi:hypothetical protein EQ500_00165 [Lactobacillus sp. XV13L]|nr:hypothetical protein [Lactobacillus sp. XV13L]
MKKSTMWTIVAVVIIAIGGGAFYATQKSNGDRVNASYNDAMTSGKNAVAVKNYKRASKAFDKAIGIKKTPEARAYKDQADSMQAAITATKAGQYTRARVMADNVITKSSGYAVLARQGRKLKATIADVQDNYDSEIKPIFTAAAQAEASKDYEKAIDEYQKVIDLPYIDGKYYAQYKKAALKGIKVNKQAAAKGNNGTAAGVDNSTAAKDTGNAGKVGEGAMGNHKVHGKTVTTKQIKQLRKRVGKLMGDDGMSWSPQDLIDLYRNSGRTKPSKITKQDVENYLKP